MKNTMELLVMPDKRIRTTMTTSDGVTTMEMHRPDECEEDVLVKMSRNKFYRRFKGDWELSLAVDSRVFNGKEFTDVTSRALAYINERDNPDIYVVSYF